MAAALVVKGLASVHQGQLVAQPGREDLGQTADVRQLRAAVLKVRDVLRIHKGWGVPQAPEHQRQEDHEPGHARHVGAWAARAGLNTFAGRMKWPKGPYCLADRDRAPCMKWPL